MSERKGYSLIIVIALVALGFWVMLMTNKYMQTRQTVKAGTGPIIVTITYPPWGTTLKWKDKTTVTATVQHIYPLDRVVFQVNTGNNKNVCTLRAEPYTCEYTVPYTGMGKGGGGTAGYGVSVYAYDIQGGVGMNVVQMFSSK
jgi:hypothetical protein